MITVVGGYGRGLTMRVPRCPEAGETVGNGVLSVDHGGKGSNQAVAIARLGGRACIVTALGEDEGADAAAMLWAEHGIGNRAVRIPGSPTMAGFIIVDATGENRIALAPGALDHLRGDHVDAAVAQLSEGDLVLVSLEIPHAAAAAALSGARVRGATTMLNPAPASPETRSLLAFSDVVTPNRGELAVLAGTEVPVSPDDVARVCHDLRATTGFDGTLVVTLGADGVLIDTGGHQRALAPIVVPAVVDTTGAGDAFSAALAVALDEGVELDAAARFAAAAGALSVTVEQVIPSLPIRAAVERLIEHGEFPA